MPPLTSPPQNQGVNGYHDFGSKKGKSGSREALSKHISQLITCGNILDLKILLQDLLTNKMAIDLDVFGAGMEYKIGGNSKCRHVVTPKFRRDRKKNPKITQHLAKPIELSSSGG